VNGRSLDSTDGEIALGGKGEEEGELKIEFGEGENSPQRENK